MFSLKGENYDGGKKGWGTRVRDYDLSPKIMVIVKPPIMFYIFGIRNEH